MAVDFEISDWGDNGLSDLHSVLFDHKVLQDDINETTAKKNQRKKKNQKTDDKADKEVKPIKLVTPVKKPKHQKQEKAKITEANETHKATKRKNKDDSQSPVSKKKKIVKKTEKRKIMEGGDENAELRNESETEEKKKKKQKEKKLDESQQGTKSADSEVTEGQVKRKKKRKKKAVNKFKTEEFLNTKKLCGRFVDLTTPTPKVPKKEHSIIPIKEKHSEITEHPKEDKKKQKSKKQKEKREKEEQPNEIDPSTDIADKTKESNKKKPIDLRTKMENKLKGARFRYINEKLYTCTGDSALELFKEDREAFQVYHDGFVEQVKSWPINPVDKMIEDLKKMPLSKIVGDFGCGDAKIAKNVKQTVHSFDLVSTNKNIITCNMANVPLADNKLDVAVFCLSLMGTNWIDYLKEANRVLKNKGMLKISEVSSRFQNLKAFILAMKRLGFSQIHKDTSNKFFISLDFKKQNSPKEISEGMNEILKPCLYKKR